MNETAKFDQTATAAPRPNQASALALRTRRTTDVNFRERSVHLIGADALTGVRVANRRGATLGTINDIILDVERGCIACVVMASGGFMGVGERLFALPWGALTRNIEGQCYVFDAERATFENAPGFDQACWPEAPFPPTGG